MCRSTKPGASVCPSASTVFVACSSTSFYSDRDDAPVAHADITTTGGRACAVDNLRVSDQEVEHVNHSSSGSGWRNNSAALRWVMRATSSADNLATLRATTCWVSGHVESACG